MADLAKIDVDLAVSVGHNFIPIHQLLRMGRGAVIALDCDADDDLVLLANDHPVAHVQVVLKGERIAVEVINVIGRDPKPDDEPSDEA